MPDIELIERLQGDRTRRAHLHLHDWDCRLCSVGGTSERPIELDLDDDDAIIEIIPPTQVASGQEGMPQVPRRLSTDSDVIELSSVAHIPPAPSPRSLPHLSQREPDRTTSVTLGYHPGANSTLTAKPAAKNAPTPPTPLGLSNGDVPGSPCLSRGAREAYLDSNDSVTPEPTVAHLEPHPVATPAPVPTTTPAAPIRPRWETHRPNGTSSTDRKSKSSGMVTPASPIPPYAIVHRPQRKTLPIARREPFEEEQSGIQEPPSPSSSTNNATPSVPVAVQVSQTSPTITRATLNWPHNEHTRQFITTPTNLHTPVPSSATVVAPHVATQPITRLMAPTPSPSTRKQVSPNPGWAVLPLPSPSPAPTSSSIQPTITNPPSSSLQCSSQRIPSTPQDTLLTQPHTYEKPMQPQRLDTQVIELPDTDEEQSVIPSSPAVGSRDHNRDSYISYEDLEETLERERKRATALGSASPSSRQMVYDAGTERTQDGQHLAAQEQIRKLPQSPPPPSDTSICARERLLSMLPPITEPQSPDLLEFIDPPPGNGPLYIRRVKRHGPTVFVIPTSIQSDESMSPPQRRLRIHPRLDAYFQYTPHLERPTPLGHDEGSDMRGQEAESGKRAKKAKARRKDPDLTGSEVVYLAEKRRIWDFRD